MTLTPGHTLFLDNMQPPPLAGAEYWELIVLIVLIRHSSECQSLGWVLGATLTFQQYVQ